MSTTFPTAIDAFANPVGTDLLENASAALDHDFQHASANDAIEALEAKVGVNGSAVTTSHDYKLSGITGTDKALSSGSGAGAQTISDLTLVDPIFTLGGDATGDMFYRNSGGEIERLPIGTNGQIIQTSLAGIPEWISNPAASDASTTVKGVSEIATTAEITAGTSTGATGAILVVPASAVGSPGASKIVQFDGTGKYPAADGSAITNITMPYTKVSTININSTFTASGAFVTIAQFTGLTGDTDDIYELDFEFTNNNVSASDALALTVNNDTTGSRYNYANFRVSSSSATSSNSVSAGSPGYFEVLAADANIRMTTVSGKIRIKASTTIAGTFVMFNSDTVATGSAAGSVGHESGGGKYAAVAEVTSLELNIALPSGSTTITGKATLTKLNR